MEGYGQPAEKLWLGLASRQPDTKEVIHPDQVLKIPQCAIWTSWGCFVYFWGCRSTPPLIEPPQLTHRCPGVPSHPWTLCSLTDTTGNSLVVAKWVIWTQIPVSDYVHMVDCWSAFGWRSHGFHHHVSRIEKAPLKTSDMFSDPLSWNGS